MKCFFFFNCLIPKYLCSFIMSCLGPELPQLERRNWFIHLHFLRKEYDICKNLIEIQLKETQGMCEYALYIQGILYSLEINFRTTLFSIELQSTDVFQV